MTLSAIDRAREYSEAKVAELRAALTSAVPEGVVMVVCGSFARREASLSSDLDYFFILPDEKSTYNQKSDKEVDDAQEWKNIVGSRVAAIVEKAPSPGGAFNEVEYKAAMARNIGGNDDTNQKLTRRMLFLLEGIAVTNADHLPAIRRSILERYINHHIGDHQIALFLLNDIIRYYRTIAVDYEFKTTEDHKPWGIRNIKLVFSRKLLYASGLFSTATTVHLTAKEKIHRLEELFDLPVIDRMTDICGKTHVQPLLHHYNAFLDRMEERNIRETLETLQPENRDHQQFRELKNQGHQFTRELMKLFESTFDATHAIRRAIVF